MAEVYESSGFSETLIRQNPNAEEQYDVVSVDSLLADNSLSGKKVVDLDFARITNVEITNAQIESVAASKITAGTITSQAIVLAANGSGDATIRAGKTDFDNSVAGFILGIDDSDSDKPKFYIGDASKYLNWDGSSLIIRGTLNADDVTAGTLTGRTVKATGGGGVDVWLDSGTGYVVFKYAGNTKGLMYVDSGGTMFIDADDNVYIQADGTGDDIALVAGDDILIDAGGDVFINGDTTIDGDLLVDGDIDATGTIGDFAEYFEATEGYNTEKIPYGTTVVMEGDKIRPARDGEKPIGAISATAGIILGSGGSDKGKSWGGKYLRNEYGKLLKETVTQWEVRNEKTRKLLKGVIEDGQKAPKGAVSYQKERKVLNPEWNPDLAYIPRKDRPEWNVVGLIGKVLINKGQPVAPNWIFLREISEKIDEYLIK